MVFGSMPPFLKHSALKRVGEHWIQGASAGTCIRHKVLFGDSLYGVDLDH